VSLCSVFLCTVCERRYPEYVIEKIFSTELALFSQWVRVTGCGLFFARAIGVQRSSFTNLGTEWREIRWILQDSRNSKILAMSDKKQIRIVKKGEKTRPIVKAKAASARETARDMVETVTNWVTEFQQKRRVETTNALRMISKTPRGSEA
jgi:hypothetical protein